MSTVQFNCLKLISYIMQYACDGLLSSKPNNECDLFQALSLATLSVEPGSLQKISSQYEVFNTNLI